MDFVILFDESFTKENVISYEKKAHEVNGGKHTRIHLGESAISLINGDEDAKKKYDQVKSSTSKALDLPFPQRSGATEWVSKTCSEALKTMIFNQGFMASKRM